MNGRFLLPGNCPCIIYPLRPIAKDDYDDMPADTTQRKRCYVYQWILHCNSLFTLSTYDK